jgi:hypothetical protein
MIDVEEGMETKTTEIADGIYRLSTYVPHIAPPAGLDGSLGATAPPDAIKLDGTTGGRACPLLVGVATG